MRKSIVCQLSILLEIFLVFNKVKKILMVSTVFSVYFLLQENHGFESWKRQQKTKSFLHRVFLQSEEFHLTLAKKNRDSRIRIQVNTNTRIQILVEFEFKWIQNIENKKRIIENRKLSFSSEKEKPIIYQERFIDWINSLNFIYLLLSDT